jgi:hypothetical protein
MYDDDAPAGESVLRVRTDALTTPLPSPFFHWQPRPLVRTPGVDNDALQPKLENPLWDFSGPTFINQRNLAYNQGAQIEGPMQQVIYGTAGVLNQQNLDLLGLLKKYDPDDEEDTSYFAEGYGG